MILKVFYFLKLFFFSSNQHITGICRDDGKRFPLQKTISNVLELAAIKSYKKSLHVVKIHG